MPQSRSSGATSDAMAPLSSREDVRPAYPKLELRAISKTYSGGNNSQRPVLTDISLKVRDGECFAMVGGSGCGKTTLLNIIAGLLDADSGSILIDGQQTWGPDIDRGVVFQQYAVFPWLTVRQNIAFGLTLKRGRARFAQKSARRALVDHYLEMVGLQHVQHELPRNLSGGMKQRVALARAYAVRPAVLLMDEPFGALDAQTRERMQNELAHLMQEEARTVVFVTHSVEEAIVLGSRVGVLRGSPSTLESVKRIDLPEGTTAEELRVSDAFVQYRRDIEQALRGGRGN